MDKKDKRDVVFTKSFDRVIDMDVNPGVKRVEIDCNVHMKHTKKSFPDVEELMIGPDVDEICIQDVYDIIAEADNMKMSKAYALDIIGSGNKNTFRL